MVFHWSLSDSKSHQVSRTRLKILAVLSNAVIWIVSTRPPSSKSSRPFNNPLVIVPKAPITTGTIVSLMFHSYFDSLARSRYLYFFAHSLKLVCRFKFRYICFSSHFGFAIFAVFFFFFFSVKPSVANAVFGFCH